MADDNERFREALKAAGLTQATAATLFEMTPKTMNNYANGRAEPPPMLMVLLALIAGGATTIARIEEIKGEIAAPA